MARQPPQAGLAGLSFVAGLGSEAVQLKIGRGLAKHGDQPEGGPGPLPARQPRLRIRRRERERHAKQQQQQRLQLKEPEEHQPGVPGILLPQRSVTSVLLGMMLRDPHSQVTAKAQAPHRRHPADQRRPRRIALPEQKVNRGQHRETERPGDVHHARVVDPSRKQPGKEHQPDSSRRRRRHQIPKAVVHAASFRSSTSRNAAVAGTRKS